MQEMQTWSTNVTVSQEHAMDYDMSPFSINTSHAVSAVVSNKDSKTCLDFERIPSAPTAWLHEYCLMAVQATKLPHLKQHDK